MSLIQKLVFFTERAWASVWAHLGKLDIQAGASVRGRAMKWPDVDPSKTFREIEREYGITKETDDVRPWNLGHHPSESYYSWPEPDFEATRREFDRIAKKVAAKHGS